MKNGIEALLIICLCAAVGVQVFRFAANKCVHRTMDRFGVIAVGIGFIWGGIRKAMMAPVPWVFVLYIIGAWLCWCAVVFSVPCREGWPRE